MEQARYTKNKTWMVKEMVDLSYPIDANTPIYPGDPTPRVASLTTIESHGYNMVEMHVGSHVGSHVDAPFHTWSQGNPIDHIGLQHFFGPLVIIACMSKHPGEAIALQDVKAYEAQIQENTILVFRTDWDKQWGKDDFFRHPYVLPEVVSYFLGKGVKTFGIDAINIDSPENGSFPVHLLVAQNNGVIIENLCGLEAMNQEKGGVWYLAAFPLKVAGADGAPCRAVAILMDINP